MRPAILLASLGLALQAQNDPYRIKLTVERQTGAEWKQVNPARVFDSGDKLRFRISANFSGYLYVMNRGTSGEYELLFPRSDAGAENRVEATRESVVPASQGWFKVSGPAGQDVVYWLLSPVALGSTYKPLPPPPAKPQGPAKPEAPSPLQPRCDDSIFQARGECIDDSAGVKAVAPGETLPSNLTGIAHAAPRELLFMQEQGGTLLSSPAPASAPFVYELRLSHR